MSITFDEQISAEQNLSFHRLTMELEQKMGIITDKGALVALELESVNGEFNNAAALLADKNTFPGVDIARFGESTNTILYRVTEEHESVLEQMDNALRVFDQYYLYEQIEGMERVRKEMIPREAFREALANALVRRQWDVRAHIKVSMFSDRIEVTSPGGLLSGISEEDYLGGGLSVARNPILANIFFRLGYIERFGTGVPRIRDAYSNLIVSPRFDVRESSITVVLPAEKSVGMSNDEPRILKVVPKGTELSRSEISRATGFAKEKTLRLVNALIAKNLLVKRGVGRSVKYGRG